MAAAGIDPDGRTLTLYSLRHTFASVAIAAGADVKTLQELMGHDMSCDGAVRRKHYAPRDAYGEACMIGWRPWKRRTTSNA